MQEKSLDPFCYQPLAPEEPEFPLRIDGFVAWQDKPRAVHRSASASTEHNHLPLSLDRLSTRPMIFLSSLTRDGLEMPTCEQAHNITYQCPHWDYVDKSEDSHTFCVGHFYGYRLTSVRGVKQLEPLRYGISGWQVASSSFCH